LLAATLYQGNPDRFGDFVDPIYPIELEIKETTNTDRSASYLDLLLAIECGGRLRTKLTVLYTTTPSTVNSPITQHCLRMKLIHLIHQCASIPVTNCAPLLSPTCSFIRMRQTSSSSNKVHVSLITIISGFRQKSEKNVSKSANKLTTIIVNSQSINSKNEMIWKVIDTRKPEIIGK
jgi:hypothetical protein